MKKHYLVIWDYNTLNSKTETPITIIINDGDTAIDIYDKILDEVSTQTSEEIDRINVLGIYKL